MSPKPRRTERGEARIRKKSPNQRPVQLRILRKMDGAQSRRTPSNAITDGAIREQERLHHRSTTETNAPVALSLMMVGSQASPLRFVLVVLASRFRVLCMFGMGSFGRIVYGRDLLAASLRGQRVPRMYSPFLQILANSPGEGNPFTMRFLFPLHGLRAFLRQYIA